MAKLVLFWRSREIPSKHEQESGGKYHQQQAVNELYQEAQVRTLHHQESQTATVSSSLSQTTLESEFRFDCNRDAKVNAEPLANLLISFPPTQASRMQTNRLFVSVQRQVEERPPSADILAVGDSAAEFANGLSAFFAPRTQKLEKSVKETYSKQCPMLMEDFDIADGHEGGAEIYCTTRSQDCQELYQQANEQAIKQFGIANPTATE
jgi:hypothetical protein